MNFIVGVIVLALIIWGVVSLVKRSNKKWLESSWTGTVLKKWMASYSDEDGEVTKTPTIQVQIDGGKKKTISLSAENYNALEVNDKVVKKAGSNTIDKA